MSRGARRSAFAFVSQNRYRWELSATVAVGYQLQLQSLDIGMCVGNGMVTGYSEKNHERVRRVRDVF